MAVSASAGIRVDGNDLLAMISVVGEAAVNTVMSGPASGIIAAAATLHQSGVRDIETSAQAAV